MTTLLRARAPLRAVILIFTLNLFWSLHPVFGKVILSRVDPMQGAWLRYSLSWLAWVGAWLALRKMAEARPRTSPPEAAGRLRHGLIAMGILTFFAAPLLQMEGLARSHATDNAILVSMEPLLAVVLAWVFLGERPGALQLLGFVLACAGVFLMSGAGTETHVLGSGLLFGNLLIVASMLGEAAYSVIGKSLVGRVDPLRGFGLAMGIGALGLGMTSLLSGHPLLPQNQGGAFWLSLILLGPVGTTGGYLVWWYLLRDVSVRVAALSLFIQPVAGAAWGSVLLGEPWNPGRVAGASLILFGVLAVVQSELDKSAAAASKG